MKSDLPFPTTRKNLQRHVLLLRLFLLLFFFGSASTFCETGSSYVNDSAPRFTFFSVTSISGTSQEMSSERSTHTPDSTAASTFNDSDYSSQDPSYSQGELRINAGEIDDDDFDFSDDDLLAAVESELLQSDNANGEGTPSTRRRSYESAFLEGDGEFASDDLVHGSHAAQRPRIATSQSTTRSNTPSDVLVSSTQPGIVVSESTTRSNTPMRPQRRHDFSAMNPIEMSDEEEEEKSDTEQPIEIEDDGEHQEFHEVIDGDDDYEEDDADVLAVKQLLDNPPEKKTQTGFKHFECPICFDHPETLAVIPCGHMYCSDCVFRAIAVKGNCSICRKNVKHTQVKFLEMMVKEDPKETADT